MTAEFIKPGETLGVMGGGQLGRMFAVAASRLGYKVIVYAADKGCPASQVASRTIIADYDDTDKLAEFAGLVSVVTLEFENIPCQAVKTIEKTTPVRPGSKVLYIAQNRLREKNFLAENGFPHVPYQAVRTVSALKKRLGEGNLPLVLKTAGFGYDGKGQQILNSIDDADAAFKLLKGQEAIAEDFVLLDRELSVIGARGLNGQFKAFGPVENKHENHILDVSCIPPRGVYPSVANKAVDITRSVMEALDVTGLLCVEFFLDETGELLINEIAPRPHNSGHYSIDACQVSQFEQQVRAISGLPLGDTACLKPAAMANILGDLWQSGEPDWQQLLRYEGVNLHLYGKDRPARGRKMGHLTCLADSAEAALETVLSARLSLSSSSKELTEIS